MVQFGAGQAITGAALRISLARRGSSQKGRGTDGERQRRGSQEEHGGAKIAGMSKMPAWRMKPCCW